MSSPSQRTTTERVLFILFALLLLWLPVPLGSNRPWAWMVMEVVAFALAGAWLAAWSAGRLRIPEALRRSWPAWIAIAAWVALQAVHVIPLPAGLVGLLSPNSARLHALAADAGVDPPQIGRAHL